MNTWKISKRLNLIIAVSVVVMLILVAVNWLGLSKLHDLQNESQRRDQEAGRLLYETGLGAQAYRIVADTFINRQFDDAAKKWQAMSTRMEEALAYYAKVADTDQEKQWAKEARVVMDELRKLYTDSFLPMAQRDAPVSELAVVDDQIDKLIDKYEGLVSQGVASLQAESVEADDAFEDGVAVTRMISIVSAALGGLVLVVLAVVVSRSITGQLGMELNDAMQAAKQVAEGDLRRLPALESASANSLAGALETMIKTLVTTVSRVRQGSEAVAIASAEIAQGNNDLSARTEQQASSLEQTAASMEQLGSTVKQNAESAHQANQLALNASIVAAQGGEVVAQVVDTMKGINEASRKIGDIIGVIDGIAFQTNILALNAAVEAARAGEQGRGFAVVASEVRSLAGRSAEAAKEIKTLISASVTRVEQGTELVDQAGETMTEVVSSIKRVTEIMGEISAASKEQSLGVNQVGEAVSHMDKTTQQNAALVEQMAAAASNLKSQAQDLVQTVAVFRLDGSNAAPVAAHHPVASPAQTAKLPGTKAVPRPATTAKPAPQPRPARLLEQAVAKVKATAKSEDGEWETF